MSISKIQDEIAEWSNRNFPMNTPEHPLMGIAEEVGELAQNYYNPFNKAHGLRRTATEAQVYLSKALHAVLKYEQGIRGTPEEHKQAAKEALQALVKQIHLLRKELGVHWYDIGVDPNEYPYNEPDKPETYYATEVVDAVGDIMVYLADFCGRSGIDMEKAFTETWEKVKQRDWQKNKTNGVV